MARIDMIPDRKALWGRLCGRAAMVMLLPAAACLAVPVDAAAQDSLCVHLETGAPGLRVELENGYTVNGTLPITFCDLRPGETWKLKADGKGLETRTGRLVLDERGTPSIEGARMSAMIRNLVLPGYGNYRAGRRASGIMDAGLFLVSGHYYLTEELEYQDMRDEYDRLLERSDDAVTYDEVTRAEEAIHYASRALNVQNTHRKRALIFFSAVYAGQLLLEPLMFGGPPGWSSEAGGSVLGIQAAPRRQAKAFLYSCLWPGKGQFYQGKSTRGVILTSLAAAAGIYALDRVNSYDEHAFRYEIEIEKMESAVSLEEIEMHSSAASAIWSELEDVKDERNIALMMLGAVWGIGIIDTFFPIDEYVPAPEVFSIEAGPSSIALVIDF